MSGIYAIIAHYGKRPNSNEEEAAVSIGRYDVPYEEKSTFEKVKAFIIRFRLWISLSLLFIIAIILISVFVGSGSSENPQPTGYIEPKHAKKLFLWANNSSLENVSSITFLADIHSYYSNIILPSSLIQRPELRTLASLKREEFKNFTETALNDFDIRVIVDITIDSVSTDDDAYVCYTKENYTGTCRYDFVWEHKACCNNRIVDYWDIDESESSVVKVGDRVKLDLNRDNVLAKLNESLASWMRGGASGIRINTISDIHSYESEKVIQSLKETVLSVNSTALFTTCEETPPTYKHVTRPALTFPPLRKYWTAEILRVIRAMVGRDYEWPVLQFSSPRYAEVQLMFSLFFPVTPIVTWSTNEKLINDPMFNATMEIRDIILQEKYEIKMMELTLGKIALARFNDNGGYIALLSYVADKAEDLDLTSLMNRNDNATVTILHKTQQCSNQNVINKEVSAKKFYVANICLLILSY